MDLCDWWDEDDHTLTLIDIHSEFPSKKLFLIFLWLYWMRFFALRFLRSCPLSQAVGSKSNVSGGNY